jgi:hypothetical protein
MSLVLIFFASFLEFVLYHDLMLIVKSEFNISLDIFSAVLHIEITLLDGYIKLPLFLYEIKLSTEFSSPYNAVLQIV